MAAIAYHVEISGREAERGVLLVLRPDAQLAPAAAAAAARATATADCAAADGSVSGGAAGGAAERALGVVLGAGVRVEALRSERALLLALAARVRLVDPDIVAGFEVQARSLGYLCERGDAVGVGGCALPAVRCPLPAGACTAASRACACAGPAVSAAVPHAARAL